MVWIGWLLVWLVISIVLGMLFRLVVMCGSSGCMVLEMMVLLGLKKLLSLIVMIEWLVKFCIWMRLVLIFGFRKVVRCGMGVGGGGGEGVVICVVLVLSEVRVVKVGCVRLFSLKCRFMKIRFSSSVLIEVMIYSGMLLWMCWLVVGWFF